MNRLACVSCLAIALTSLSCSHTRTATDQPRPAAQSDASPEERGAKPPRARNAERRPDAEGGSGTQDQGTGDPAALPLATSPAGLLKPGAAEAIQTALSGRGYLSPGKASGKLDGATEKALRSFQDDNHLPATGMPDDLTVRKLGLELTDIFKATPSE